MKVVLDTNVVISGIFWKGAPHHILKAWAEGRFELVVSKNILDEYVSVIRRIDTEGDLAEKWAVYLTDRAAVVEDTEVLKLARDPDDDMFINTAIVSKARFVVSGDDDLLSLKGESPVRVITPHVFLKILRKDTR